MTFKWKVGISSHNHHVTTAALRATGTCVVPVAIVLFSPLPFRIPLENETVTVVTRRRLRIARDRCRTVLRTPLTRLVQRPTGIPTLATVCSENTVVPARSV